MDALTLNEKITLLLCLRNYLEEMKKNLESSKDAYVIKFACEEIQKTESLISKVQAIKWTH